MENSLQYELGKYFDKEVPRAYGHVGIQRASEMAATYQKMAQQAAGFNLEPFARNMEIGDADISALCKRVILNCVYEVSHSQEQLLKDGGSPYKTHTPDAS